MGLGFRGYRDYGVIGIMGIIGVRVYGLGILGYDLGVGGSRMRDLGSLLAVATQTPAWP